MADRSLVVKLRAEIGSYKADMDSAAKATKGVADAAETGSKKAVQSNAAMGKSAKDAGAAVKAAGDDAGKAKGGISSLSEAIRDNRGAWDDLSNKAAVGGLAIAAGIGVAVKRFADFDAAMSAVQANSGSTGAELDALREAAIQLGADSQFSAAEAADGINELAKAGVAAGDILGGGLKGSLDLAAAGQIGVGEAAETAATAMTQFNLEGGEIPHVADLLTNAANKAQGGVGDLAQALKQGGLVAASTGLTIDETTASLAAFASAGLVGSDAGTSLKTMLQRLSAPSGKAAQEMARLGISAYDAQGEFVGMEALAGQLKTGLEDLTPAQRNAALATIFGSDAVRAANILYSEGSAGIAKWTDEVTESGAAAKQAAILNDNLKGDIERLGGALDSVFISTGGSANGALRTLTQGLTGFVDYIGKIPGPVLLAGSALASLALMGPKAITSFNDYRANLDSLGLSMDKLSTKAPRTAKAISGVGRAVAGLAIAGTAIGLMQDDLGSIGSEQLIRDLEGTASSVDAINAAIAKADGGTSDIQDLGSALKTAFDPNVIDKAGSGIDGFFSIFGAEKTGEVAMASSRLKELDSTMAQMVSSGNPEGARAMMASIEAEAKKQGISVDDLKAKFPLLAEAYAAAENSGDGLNEGMSETEQAAEDAKMAIDDLKNALEIMGGGFRAEQAASRDVTASLKEMRTAVTEGKGGWSELSAAMEDSAGKALTYAGAQAEMGRGSETIAAGIQRVRDQVIKSGTDAGYSKAFMEQYADSIGLIPEEATTLVEAAGVTESTANVMGLSESIMLLNGKTVTVKEEGANPSKGRVIELDGSIFGLKGKTVKVEEIGATASGDRVVRLDGKIYTLKGKTVDVIARTSGEQALANLQGQINRMSGRSISVNTYYNEYRSITDMGTYKARAMGGIESHGVTLMEDGGMIAPGRMRPDIYKTSKRGILMAEDPTAPFESYISGRADLRPRSLKVLGETARLMGHQVIPMATGGIHASRTYVAPQPRATVMQAAPVSSGPSVADISPAAVEHIVGAVMSRFKPVNPSGVYQLAERGRTEMKGRGF